MIEIETDPDGDLWAEACLVGSGNRTAMIRNVRHKEHVVESGSSSDEDDFNWKVNNNGTDEESQCLLSDSEEDLSKNRSNPNSMEFSEMPPLTQRVQRSNCRLTMSSWVTFDEECPRQPVRYQVQKLTLETSMNLLRLDDGVKDDPCQENTSGQKNTQTMDKNLWEEDSSTQLSPSSPQSPGDECGKQSPNPLNDDHVGASTVSVCSQWLPYNDYAAPQPYDYHSTFEAYGTKTGFVFENPQHQDEDPIRNLSATSIDISNSDIPEKTPKVASKKTKLRKLFRFVVKLTGKKKSSKTGAGTRGCSVSTGSKTEKEASKCQMSNEKGTDKKKTIVRKLFPRLKKRNLGKNKLT